MFTSIFLFPGLVLFQPNYMFFPLVNPRDVLLSSSKLVLLDFLCHSFLVLATIIYIHKILHSIGKAEFFTSMHMTVRGQSIKKQNMRWRELNYGASQPFGRTFVWYTRSELTRSSLSYAEVQNTFPLQEACMSTLR